MGGRDTEILSKSFNKLKRNIAEHVLHFGVLFRSYLLDVPLVCLRKLMEKKLNDYSDVSCWLHLY